MKVYLYHNTEIFTLKRVGQNSFQYVDDQIPEWCQPPQAGGFQRAMPF